jgi:hypothetical protein
MTHGVNAARCLTQATEAALAGDYHKAAALSAIAITHLMVAATPEPRIEPEADAFGPEWVDMGNGEGHWGDEREAEDVTDPGWSPTIYGRPVSDFISDIPYQNYDTVLGYLATHLPHHLDLMDLTAEATVRDGWALKNACARAGQPVHKVEAPRFLKEEGIQAQGGGHPGGQLLPPKPTRGALLRLIGAAA